MKKGDWTRVNHLQIGKYTEYFVKMEFTLYGFDVYTSEVDQHGIDFVIRRGHNVYYDVQVKSVREFNYIFFQKDKFEIRQNLLAVIAIFFPEEAPRLCIVRSDVWQTPDSFFVSR